MVRMTETTTLTGVVEPSVPVRVETLREAANLITGERQTNYGSPEVNFQRIANYWNTYLGDKLSEGSSLSPRNVADLMTLLKIARLSASPTADTYVDMAGYAGIASEFAETERKNKNVQ